MRVCNIHERSFITDPATLGALIDTLASENDRLWPRERWPAMRFDRPLATGAIGRHGPIRYFVADYQPGRRITSTFTGPRGFQGQHGFQVESGDGGRALLRHRIDMILTGYARLSWTLVYRPLHDALLEDAFDKAQRQLGQTPGPRVWGSWVRILRRLPGRRSRRPGQR